LEVKLCVYPSKEDGIGRRPSGALWRQMPDVRHSGNFRVYVREKDSERMVTFLRVGRKEDEKEQEQLSDGVLVSAPSGVANNVDLEPTYWQMDLEYSGDAHRGPCCMELWVQKKLVDLCLVNIDQMHTAPRLSATTTFSDILEAFDLLHAAPLTEISSVNGPRICITDAGEETVAEILDMLGGEPTRPVLVIHFSKIWFSRKSVEMTKLISDIETARSEIGNLPEFGTLSSDHLAMDQAIEQALHAHALLGEIKITFYLFGPITRVAGDFKKLIDRHIACETSHSSRDLQELRFMCDDVVRYLQQIDVFKSQYNELCFQFLSLEPMKRAFHGWSASDVLLWLQHTDDRIVLSEEVQERLRCVNGSRLAEVHDLSLQMAGIESADIRKRILDSIQSLLANYGDHADDDDDEKEDSQGRCVICTTAQVDTVIFPCGHVACCNACLQQMMAGGHDDRCPVCRAHILHVMPVFHAALQ